MNIDLVVAYAVAHPHIESVWLEKEANRVTVFHDGVEHGRLDRQQLHALVDPHFLCIDYASRNRPTSSDASAIYQRRMVLQSAQDWEELRSAGGVIAQVEREATRHIAERYGEGCLDRRERALRLLEETIELAQAEGVDEATAGRLVRRTFSRPAGNARDELGDLGFCLLAYTAVTEELLLDETLRRIAEANATPIEESRARHAAKKALGISDGLRPATALETAAVALAKMPLIVEDDADAPEPELF